MRRAIPLYAFCIALSACGDSGGGGGSGSGSGRGGPTRSPEVFFVRLSGDDQNAGTSPDQPFGTLAHAARNLVDGDRIIVGPGVYSGMIEITHAAGTAKHGITILADSSGALTNDRPGEVIIDAAGALAGLRVSNSRHVTIDGFRIVGATDANGAAILLRDRSTDVSIRHCVISGNRDGIRAQNTADLLIFNNLIANNSNRGIRIADGSQRARVMSNTIVENGNRGIDIGGGNAQGIGSTDAVLRNNIIQNNRNIAISVDSEPPSALVGYDGDFNLVYSAGVRDQSTVYRPPSIAGANDINTVARFVNVNRGDFHLNPARSPAIDAGTDDIDPLLLDELLQRSTTRDNVRDEPPVDLGYHFPP